MEKLKAETMAYEIMKHTKPIVDLVAKHDRTLKEQMRSCCQSVCQNVAEGLGRMQGDRTHSYRIASGSVRELEACIRIAVAWGYVPEERAGRLLRMVDEEIRLLWGLTEGGRAGRSSPPRDRGGPSRA